jgi:outer membrane protein TolC
LFEKSTAVANQVKSAERLEPIIRKRYETNLSSLEELFQSNIDIFESKRDLVINNYDLQSTEYRLLQGTGELLDYFKFKKLPSL